MAQSDLKAFPDTDTKPPSDITQGDVIVFRGLLNVVTGWAEVLRLTNYNNWYRFWLSDGRTIDVNSDATPQIEILL